MLISHKDVKSKASPGLGDATFGLGEKTPMVRLMYTVLDRYCLLQAISVGCTFHGEMSGSADPTITDKDVEDWINKLGPHRESVQNPSLALEFCMFWFQCSTRLPRRLCTITRSQTPTCARIAKTTLCLLRCATRKESTRNAQRKKKWMLNTKQCS